MDLASVPPKPTGFGGTSASTTEAVLLRRAATGDQAAFAELYDLTAARIYGLVRRVVRNPAISEEVAQDAFTEIWRQSARFDPDRGSAIGWMLTIAHRRAVDRVRSEDASERRDDAWSRSVEIDHDQTVDHAERSMDGIRIRRALRNLTEVQRRSIELAFYGGYTHTEVAALLDVPVGTAKTRIRDGLIRLRDEMGAER